MYLDAADAFDVVNCIYIYFGCCYVPVRTVVSSVPLDKISEKAGTYLELMQHICRNFDSAAVLLFARLGGIRVARLPSPHYPE